MSLDAFNTVVAILSFVAVVWSVFLHRHEVRMQAREAESRILELRQSMEALQRQNDLQSRQVALLAINAYVQSHQEARATFPKVELSRRAIERVRQANRASSRLLDETLDEMQGRTAPAT